MDTNSHGDPIPTFGPMVPYGDLVPGFETPEWIEIEGKRYPWDPSNGAYKGLYIEPLNDDGDLDPYESYYEIEED